MEKFRIRTSRRQEMVDITRFVEESVRKAGVKRGLCMVYCPHTTGAVTINEGADPDVASDILMGLGRLVPDGLPFGHREGNADAHLKASLIGPSENLIVCDGRLALGTWQKIFFCEFDGPRERTVCMELIPGGEI
ncbi:MAG: YjbQ family protein [Proteobacteria bacterium]|nr:YjbQ family protein [Pseudomonadota bacterium]